MISKDLLDKINEIREVYPLSLDVRYMSLALCGEAGELANLVKKQWGNYQSIDPDDVKRELAGVVNHCIHQMINLGMTPEDLDKYCSEKADRFFSRLKRQTPPERL